MGCRQREVGCCGVTTCWLPPGGYGILQRLRWQRMARCQIRSAAEACQESGQ